MSKEPDTLHFAGDGLYDRDVSWADGRPGTPYIRRAEKGSRLLVYINVVRCCTCHQPLIRCESDARLYRCNCGRWQVKAANEPGQPAMIVMVAV